MFHLECSYIGKDAQNQSDTESQFNGFRALRNSDHAVQFL